MINNIMSGPKFQITKRESSFITRETIEKKSQELLSQGVANKIIISVGGNLLPLLTDDNRMDNSLLDLAPIVNQLDYHKFHDCLERRDTYLENHEKLPEEEFKNLFLKPGLSSFGKYNKVDFHQGGIGECGLISWLEILKKTPFFETMIRCSLKKTDNGRTCLIPLCNQQGEYEEITNDEIEYLKVPYFQNGRSVLSDSSLGFNILETFFLKKYFKKSRHEDILTMRDVGYDIINQKIVGFDASNIRDIFLGKNALTTSIGVTGTSKEGLQYLLELSKIGIIKLCCLLKIPNGYTYQNLVIEEVDSTRGYKVRVYKDTDDFKYGVDEQGRVCFSPKSCNEWFIPQHVYSIENILTKDNKTYVVIKNPWFTEKTFTIPLEQFYSMISCFDVLAFNIDNLFK